MLNSENPGATAKETADDVPIMASEGEYVIPANVVRFLGLDKIEKMVGKAKEHLAEMEANGRMGGEAPPSDLPVSPNELQSTPAVPGMAEGGVVSKGFFDEGGGDKFTGVKQYKNGDQVMFIPYFNGSPIINVPEGFTEATAEDTTENQPQTSINPTTGLSQSKGGYADNSAAENGKFVEQNKSPLAGDPNNWSVDDFINFGENKDNFGNKAIKGMISMLPGGKLGMLARDRYLNSSTAELMDKMLETGVDLQGNPIPDSQKVMLSQTRQNLIDQMGDHSGLNLSPFERIGDAFKSFTNFVSGGQGTNSPNPQEGGSQGAPISSLSQEAYQSTTPPTGSDAQYSGGGYGMGSDIGRDPSQGPSSGQMASGGLYKKGGLIVRKNKKC